MPRRCRGLKASTQFARAMRELGIAHVFARSPQAKGRVERAAGTFQDRLVTELRHARASTPWTGRSTSAPAVARSR